MDELKHDLLKLLRKLRREMRWIGSEEEYDCYAGFILDLELILSKHEIKEKRRVRRKR